MKFIRANLNNSGTIIIRDKSEVELTLTEVYDDLRNNPQLSVCYLTLPSNFPGRGSPIKPEVAENEYLTNPAKYGLAIYRSWNNNIVYE